MEKTYRDFVIRPITLEDFPAYKDLAYSVKGMTSLPKDENRLLSKLEKSKRSFDPTIKKPGMQYYLFCLEDLSTGEMAGICGITAKVGGFQPFYSYKIKTEHFESKSLKVSIDQELLSLEKEYNGPSETCSLLLNEKYRGLSLGRLLSLSRFLFMVAFPERFEEEVIAEMRGVSDDKGMSPFWDCIGQHFFKTDFVTADYLCGLGDKDFIDELMPKYPLFTSILPDAAREVIGRVHQDTLPARRLLESEGFRFQGRIDIFDGGPTLRAKVKDVRTIAKARQPVVKAFSDDIQSNELFLIGNGSLDYRSVVSSVDEQGDEVVLPSYLSNVLGKSVGDKVWISPIK
jgi:arginine N-succinyltransferase